MIAPKFIGIEDTPGKENEAKNQWVELCAAHEIASKTPKSQAVVYLYDSADLMRP